MGKKRINVIYPPSVTWDGKRQRPHHLLAELSRRGMNVYFIDTQVKRPPKKFCEIEKNFYYASDVQTCLENLKQGVNIYYANFPGAMHFAPRFNIDLILYDYLDDFPHRRQGEMDLIRNADIATASGKLLFHKAKGVREQVEYLSNGCHYWHFKQAENRLESPELDGITRPIIGYIGAIAYWLDWDLLSKVVTQFDFAKFVFIGDNYKFQGENIKKIRPVNDNILFMGPKDYEDLPRFLSRFDVCLIPFNTQEEVIKATNPIKIYEYFASGKPVVATEMPEIENLKPCVSMSNNSTEFAKKIAWHLKNNDGLKKERQKIAREEDWGAKGEQLYQLLLGGLKQKGVVTDKVPVIEIQEQKKTRFLFLSEKYAARNLCENLGELEGVEVKNLKLNKRENENYIKEKIEEGLREFKPDFVFWEGMCIPFLKQNKLLSLLQNLKEGYGFKILYWATEDPPHHQSVCVKRAAVSDFVFCTSAGHVGKYEAIGKPASNLLFAANTLRHKPRIPEKKYQCDLLYIGNNYNHKLKIKGMKQMFLPLRKKKYDFRIYGIWWTKNENPHLKNRVIIPAPVWKGNISYSEVSWAYSSAKITLGLQVDEEDSTHTPFRPYEVLASGGFHISQYSRAMENIFGSDNDKVVLIRPEENFLEIVDYYLLHPEERNKIAENGRKFVLEKHTYKHRAEQILCDLGEAELL